MEEHPHQQNGCWIYKVKDRENQRKEQSSEAEKFIQHEDFQWASDRLQGNIKSTIKHYLNIFPSRSQRPSLASFQF